VTLHRVAARRDQNEKVICEALNRVGVVTWRISAPGVPDLLCGHRGRWFLIEVKFKRAGLSPDQQRFHAVAATLKLPVHTVRTVEEALDVVGGVAP